MVIEVDGSWTIQKPNGCLLKPIKSGRSNVFPSKDVAEAALEYLGTPKPANTVRIRRQLAVEIAGRHGVKWSREEGFNL